MYSTEPADWATDRSTALQADIAALPKVAVTRNADGPATIETYSVRYDWPEHVGIIIGRLDADDSRFMAVTTDEDLVALMSDGEPRGRLHRGEVDGATAPIGPRWSVVDLLRPASQHASLGLGTLAVPVAVTFDATEGVRVVEDVGDDRADARHDMSLQVERAEVQTLCHELSSPDAMRCVSSRLRDYVAPASERSGYAGVGTYIASAIATCPA